MDDNTLEITVEMINRHKGMANVLVRLGGKLVHSDYFNLYKEDARWKFADKLIKKHQDIDHSEVNRLLLEAIPLSEDDDDGEDHENQAQILLRLAKPATLFHTSDGETFATISVGGHTETHRIRSTSFRRWLINAFYRECEKPPSSEAMRGAIEVLEAEAQFDGPTEQVWIRVASIIDPNDPDRETFYIDLCNDRWQVVQIDRDGWRVLDTSPVKFRRTQGMLPLPVPVRDGTRDLLRSFVNIPAPNDKNQPDSDWNKNQPDSDWMLFVAVLTAAFRPYGPYPVLEVNGEQGCAKSTTSRVFRACVDPHKVMLRSMPKEDRDLMISANNCWCQAFDNLSRLPEWLSDALCRQATGGGFSTRALYTDEGEVHFDTMRPVLLTGIANVAERDDLGDRLIRIVLPVIPDENRREEKSFWREFEASLPKILGAILDVVVGGLKALPDVHVKSLPRMADFGRWGEAVGRALGWKDGAFLEAYKANRSEASAQALEDSAVATAVRTLMKDRDAWEGIATELLTALSALAGDAVVKDKERRWPKTGRGLAGQLRRLAPLLRRVGIEPILDLPREGKESRRIIRIKKSSPTVRDRESSPASSASSAAAPENDGTSFDGERFRQADGRNPRPTVSSASSAQSSASSAQSSASSASPICPQHNSLHCLDANGRPMADDADGADTDSPHSSSRTEEKLGPREVIDL
jgi:hypothetical protein